MNVLFLHPGFPGQFGGIASALAESGDCHVVAVGQRGLGTELRHVTFSAYEPGPPLDVPLYPPIDPLANSVRRGRAAAAHLRHLDREGFRPDVVVIHPGWGDGFFLRDVLPDVPVIAYAEYFYRARGSDLDFDPEFGFTDIDLEFVRLRNLPTVSACAEADAIVTPTAWQASLFPMMLRSRASIIHEGIDTAIVRPAAGAGVRLPTGGTLTRSSEVLTYVARGLEPYRGFHMFMRALPELQRRRPGLFAIVVGADRVSYGQQPPRARNWREAMLAELDGQLDLDRIWFTGTLPYAQYLDVLRVSTVHLYLTYPFVTSWSLLEAMSAGCAIAGSDTPPVTEFISDHENGRLTPFFDRSALVDTVVELLSDAPQRARLGAAARDLVVSRYDFQTRTLPRYRELLTDVAAMR